MEKKLDNRKIIALMKMLVKRVLEEMMAEEKKEYLERKLDIKGNGYYTRGLICGLLGIEDLRVPRIRNGNFCILY